MEQFVMDHIPKTSALVERLKSEDQDFEWYPTTEEMMSAIKNDMQDVLHLGDSASVLDCGAGDGRMLRYLTKGDKYAIEKSKPLLSILNLDIYIVGTDFHQQTLIDKKVSVLVSNPPYSHYSVWADKIIREANASSAIYLVVPARWKEDPVIQRALEARNVEAEIIFKGDFLHADRRARAKVHVIRIKMSTSHRYGRGEWHKMKKSGTLPKIAVGAFDLWFDEHFKIKASKDTLDEWSRKERERDDLKEQIQGSGLVEKKGLIEALVEFYNRDLANLMETYKSLSDVDSDLLSELDVNITGVKEALRQRITGLKDIYWRELFDRLESVTNRLTSKSRNKLLSKLFEQTSIDFSIDNAHALALWIVKNANEYLETQLIETFEKMVNAASIVNYVSNKKTFGKENWYYTRRSEDFSHYKLDHRIILSNLGGLKKNWYSGEVEGLSQDASTFIDDLMTVASNIGFSTEGMHGAASGQWDSGIKNNFYYREPSTGKLCTLLEVKAFQNGNLHLKLN